MAKIFLTKANQLDSHLVAIIALPGNSVRTAISVYNSFDDTAKEHALQQSKDLLEKALELQNIIRRNQYLMDGWEDNFKPSLRYLNIDEDETINDSTLFIILQNMIDKEEEELRDWSNCYM